MAREIPVNGHFNGTMDGKSCRLNRGVLLLAMPDSGTCIMSPLIAVERRTTLKASLMSSKNCFFRAASLASGNQSWLKRACSPSVEDGKHMMFLPICFFRSGEIGHLSPHRAIVASFSSSSFFFFSCRLNSGSRGSAGRSRFVHSK